MSVHRVDLETKNKILIEKSGYDAKIDNFSEKVLLLVNVYAVFFFDYFFFLLNLWHGIDIFVSVAKSNGEWELRVLQNSH